MDLDKDDIAQAERDFDEWLKTWPLRHTMSIDTAIAKQIFIAGYAKSTEYRWE